MSQGADWNRERLDAEADLLEDGAVFVFTREKKGAYDPVAGAFATGEKATFSAPGIVKPLNPSVNRIALSWQAQGLILAGDEMLLVGCAAYEPELEDRAALNGQVWVVKGVSLVRPALVPVLAYLLIRRM